MTATTKLDLELLQNGAANQTLSNETFHQLNQLVQAAVVDRATTPPGSPANEALYLIIATATGVWAGKENQLAYWLTSTSAWQYVTPREGMIVHVNDEDVFYKYDGSAWAIFSAGGGVSLPVVQALSSTRNLALADINTFNVNSTTNNYIVTIPPQSSVVWTADAEIHFLPSNTGDITITGGTGVSVNGVVAGSVTLSTQNGAASIKRTAADTWWVGGSLGTQAEQQAALGLTGASLEWTTYGGTANAITLTPLVARSVYVTGDKVRFRATATNTGATTINVSGLGVKTCVTVTGATLPAGYIRTDVDTSAVYDGTNFVVDRMTEYGTNANGIFERSATGFLKCFFTSPVVSKDITVAAFGGFKSGNETWTYPAAFITTPTSIQAKVAGETAFGCEIASGTTNTTANFFYLAITSQAAANRAARLEATGRWY